MAEIRPKSSSADLLTMSPMSGAHRGAVVDLSNRVLGRYAGTNVRTIGDFTWRCLDRPGVEESGSFVVSQDGSVVGYLVMRTNGEVLDCIVERNAQGSRIMRLLLAEAERYAQAACATRILMNLPADRPDLCREVEAAGFAGASSTNLYLGPKNLPRLVELLQAESGAGRHCDLGFDVRSPVESEQAKFRLNRGVVTEGDETDAAIRIIVGRGALSSILFAGGSVFMAVARREMRVKPIVALPAVASVLRRLARSDPWFFNRSDII